MTDNGIETIKKIFFQTNGKVKAQIINDFLRFGDITELQAIWLLDSILMGHIKNLKVDFKKKGK